MGADLHKKQVFKSFEFEKKQTKKKQKLAARPKSTKTPEKKHDICDKSAQTQKNPVFLAFIRLLFPQRSPGSVQQV